MPVLKCHTVSTPNKTVYFTVFSVLFILKCLIIKHLLKIITINYKLLTVLCIYTINKRECEVIQFIRESQVINQKY